MLPQIQENVILGPLTTFKIGGPAKFFAAAKTKEEIRELAKWAKEKDLPVFALSGGSNILVSDRGFGGLVIQIQNSGFKIDGQKIFAEAGTPLAKLISESVKAELSGLEWAVGIPGRLGGAICGNAGAYRKHISEIIEEVEALNLDDMTIKKFANGDCRFDYRESVFKQSHDFIILSAVLKLQKSTKEEVAGRLKEVLAKRTDLNETGLKCAGCVFKNIRWTRSDINKDELLKKFPDFQQFADKSAIPVAYLIEQLGLKEKQVGNARISLRHANYFINLGGAKAEDVVILIGIAKEKIQQKYQLLVEEEIKYVGF